MCVSNMENNLNILKSKLFTITPCESFSNYLIRSSQESVFSSDMSATSKPKLCSSGISRSSQTSMTGTTLVKNFSGIRLFLVEKLHVKQLFRVFIVLITFRCEWKALCIRMAFLFASFRDFNLRKAESLLLGRMIFLGYQLDSYMDSYWNQF